MTDALEGIRYTCATMENAELVDVKEITKIKRSSAPITVVK